MVKSNAERQREYRERRNAAARGETLGQMARDAIDRGLAICWAVYARNPIYVGPQEHWSSLEEFRIATASGSRGDPAAEARDWISSALPVDGHDLASPPSVEEEVSLRRAIEVLDAALLRHVDLPPPSPKKARTKKPAP